VETFEKFETPKKRSHGKIEHFLTNKKGRTQCTNAVILFVEDFTTITYYMQNHNNEDTEEDEKAQLRRRIPSMKIFVQRRYNSTEQR